MFVTIFAVISQTFFQKNKNISTTFLKTKEPQSPDTPKPNILIFHPRIYHQYLMEYIAYLSWWWCSNLYTRRKISTLSLHFIFRNSLITEIINV